MLVISDVQISIKVFGREHPPIPRPTLLDFPRDGKTHSSSSRTRRAPARWDLPSNGRVAEGKSTSVRKDRWEMQLSNGRTVSLKERRRVREPACKAIIPGSWFTMWFAIFGM